MKKLTIFTVMILTVVGIFAVSQSSLLAKSSVSATAAMQTASQLYQNGQYAQSAQAFQQLADQGITDSTLYYNLGNAYFKAGDTGRAILNYRRAEALAPRDADIRANLAFARAQTVDQLTAEPDSAGFFSQAVQFSQRWLSINELAIITLGLWFIIAIAFVIYRSAQSGFWHKAMRYTLVLAIFGLMIGGIALGSRLYIENERPVAVIVAPEVAISSGPGQQYPTTFTLHSGSEVNIVEARNNWVRLALPGDAVGGWVPANAVTAVQGS